MKKFISLVLFYTGLISISLFIAKPARANFRFVSWADTKSGTSYFETLSNQVDALNPAPAFTIYEGDLEDHGFSSGIDIWKIALNGGSSPGNGLFNITFPVRGNHDKADPAGWQTYFDLRGVAGKLCSDHGGSWNTTGGTCTGGSIGPVNYREGPNSTLTTFYSDMTYSYDYENSHFLGVDTADSGDIDDLTQDQLTWIDNDLAAAESRGLIHAFLFFHGPVYPIAYHSCKSFPCGSEPFIDNTKITAVINKHPIVSATFNGHEHLYSWIHIDNKRITGATHEYEQFHTGNAGAEYESCPEYCRMDRINIVDNDGNIGYVMNSGDAHGFVTIDVVGDTFTVNFYDSSHPNVSQKNMTFKKGSGSSTPQPTPRISPTPRPSPRPTPSATPTTRNGDADGNGIVNTADITYVLPRWLQNLATSADQFIDGKINSLDFAVVAKALML